MRWLLLVVFLVSSITVRAQSKCQLCTRANTLSCPITLGCKIPASYISGCPADCGTPSGTSCTECNHAAVADSAKVLTGTISGSQVTTCPASCVTVSTVPSSTTTLPSPSAGGWTVSPGPVQTTKQVLAHNPLASTSAGFRLEGESGGDVIVNPGGKTLIEGAYSAIPNGSYVTLGSQYLTTPPTNYAWKVTQAGWTANVQPPGFPIPRYNLQPVVAGQRLLRNAGWNPAWYWTAATGCTTAAAPSADPCWISPTTGCTMTDGTCVYAAQPVSALGAVTDGTAVFVLGDGDAAHHAPAIQFSRGFNNGINNDHAVELYTGDNETETLVIRRGYYWNLPRTNPAAGAEWALQAGGEGLRIAGSQHPFTIIGQSGPVLGEEATADSIANTPNLPPLVTLSAGGTLTVGQTYCFSQAWQRRETGGLGPAGQYACVTATATNRTITLQPRILGSLIGNGLITFYQMLGGFFSQRVTTVNGPTDTVTITADADLGGETRGAVTENQTGNPVLDVISNPQGGWPWQPGQVVPVDVVTNPPNQWATIPPTPFLYQINAGGCDASCTHCTTFGHLRSVTTGSAPPTWRTDATLFCDNAGTQYQKWDWNGLRVAIPYNPAMDRGAAGSLGIFAFGNGEDLIYREIAGRPQFVCNTLPQPGCDASTRGLHWIICGSGTSGDVEQRCMRTSSGTFVWTTIATAG